MDGMLSPADVAVLSGNAGTNGNNGYGFGGDGAWWIILFLIFGWGRNGFGNGYGSNGGGIGENFVLQTDFATIERKLDGINNGICDSTFALNNSVKDGFYSVNSNISSALCNTTYELAGKIDANRFAAQQCCCETQRAIDGVNYNNAKNTCEIVNAIHNEGNLTRDLITQNKIEMLQAKLADKDRDIQTRDFQLSQLSQNAYLVKTLNPTPIPAYQVAHPNCCYKPCGCGCGYFAE